MSQGPTIVIGSPGKMRPAAIPTLPGLEDYSDNGEMYIYGAPDKREFYSLLLENAVTRRSCSCRYPNTTDEGCPDPACGGAVRPASIEAIRDRVAKLRPVWPAVLDYLEANPDAFVEWE